MSFPSVADVLVDFEELVQLKKTTVINSADFKRETVTSNESVRAVIQPERAENLRIENIDYALRYIRVHSRFDIDIQDFINYEGRDYRMITKTDWGSRGYVELIGEEVK